MRKFDPQLAEIRFGYGLSPVIGAPASIYDMLAGLQAPDTMTTEFPIESFADFRPRIVLDSAARKRQRENKGTDIAEKARQEREKIIRSTRRDWLTWMGHTLLRRAYSQTAFRERIVSFWADHFTAIGKGRIIRHGTTPYVDTAIRPHITGTFTDILKASVKHPLMLNYLDQGGSVGPNSKRAGRGRAGNSAGLNENLAREVLELHTLGVDGPYTQTDVRELAELFTGMTFQPQSGYEFRKAFVEPGAETVLGETYGDVFNDSAIDAVLDDLARHPATARHIAWKLAVHFVSDSPDPSLVDALEATYLKTDGALMPLYVQLLEHPAAWDVGLINFKSPIDFLSSAARALAVKPDVFDAMEGSKFRRLMNTPLSRMGQNWERPGGPDGWPEEDPHWITPQGLAARMTWAMGVPQAFMDTLPDPRVFVDTALGEYANDAVRFAAGAAESKPEAIGLVLMSPAFQRR